MPLDGIQLKVVGQLNTGEFKEGDLLEVEQFEGGSQ